MMYTVVLYHHGDWFVFDADMLGTNMRAGCAVANYS